MAYGGLWRTNSFVDKSVSDLRRGHWLAQIGDELFLPARGPRFPPLEEGSRATYQAREPPTLVWKLTRGGSEQDRAWLGALARNPPPDVLAARTRMVGDGLLAIYK